MSVTDKDLDRDDDRKGDDGWRQEWKPGSDPGTEVAEYLRQGGGPVSLVVDQNSSGPVTVSGWEKSETRILATRRVRGHLPPGRDDKARDILSEGELFIEARGEEVVVETRQDRHWGFWDSERVVIAIEAWVPRSSRVNIDSGSGRIEIRDTKGSVRVDSGSGGVLVVRAAGGVELDLGSGSVTVEEVQGGVKVDVGSGAVSVSRVKGAVEVDGSSGSVSLTEVEGSIQVDTASGSVRMSRIIGDVSVDTGSGSVRLDTLRGKRVNVDTGSGAIEAGFDVLPDGRYSFDAGSGRITLTVPEDASFSLEAESGSGRIDCSLPLVVSQADRGSLTGVMGDGSARIAADASSGGIIIRGRAGSGAGEVPSSRSGQTAGAEVRAAVTQLKAENRNAILKMVQEGKLTAIQGEGLLLAIARSTAPSEPANATPAVTQAPSAAEPPAQPPAPPAEPVAPAALSAAPPTPPAAASEGTSVAAGVLPSVKEQKARRGAKG
jgi:DUF4097 and DUF4098 domain-containing protein YvlB